MIATFWPEPERQRYEAAARRFRHPESGLVTLEQSLQLYAWHGRHHLAQDAHLPLRAMLADQVVVDAVAADVGQFVGPDVAALVRERWAAGELLVSG